MPTGAIPDGVTAEVEFKLAPVEAVRMPRSALTFSAEGELSVRTVGADGIVATVPGRRSSRTRATRSGSPGRRTARGSSCRARTS